MKKNKRKNSSYMEFDSDTDDTFYFIVDYTDGGAPFGVTWEEIISQELFFRPASRKDGKPVAELIHTAIGDIAEQQTGQTKTKNIRETIANFFRQENNRFSYLNILVADVVDEVAGIILTYPGEDAPELDEPILKRLRKKNRNPAIVFEKEVDEGDFYIDTVSVHPKFQGYGIGTKLLKEAEKLAVQKGYHTISLNVAKDNPSARKLYKKLGYHEKKVIKINGHPYDYLVKILL